MRFDNIHQDGGGDYSKVIVPCPCVNPTWDDAMAHCNDEIKEITTKVLREHGISVGCKPMEIENIPDDINCKNCPKYHTPSCPRWVSAESDYIPCLLHPKTDISVGVDRR